MNVTDATLNSGVISLKILVKIKYSGGLICLTIKFKSYMTTYVL